MATFLILLLISSPVVAFAQTITIGFNLQLAPGRFAMAEESVGIFGMACAEVKKPIPDTPFTRTVEMALDPRVAVGTLFLLQTDSLVPTSFILQLMKTTYIQNLSS